MKRLAIGWVALGMRPAKVRPARALPGLQWAGLSMGSAARRVACAGLALAAVLAAGLFLASPAGGQVTSVTVTVANRPLSAHVIVPQSRSFAVSSAMPAPGASASASPIPARSPVTVTDVKVGVVILEQVATTTMDISLRNTSSSRAEAEMVVPVPDGAVVKGFTFEGAAKEPTAELLPKDEAKRIYNEIVAKTRDPALLEFAGYNLIRSSVFPVEARGVQKVRLTYEHLLSADGDRVDYVLPRSESLDYNIPWDVSLSIKSKSPIATVYSPSHQLEIERKGGGVVGVRMAKASATEPGAFRLSYLRQREGVTASLMAYPDAKLDGGYFLLLASVPPKPAPDGEAAAPAIKRELTIVIDRSGSMAGEKIEQVRAAALLVIQGLGEGEAFNIIDYSDSISSFAPAPVVRTADNAEEARRYLRRLAASGGTNLHDAVLEALRPKPREGMLPIVLFLTDGLPTVGIRDEVTIRSDVEAANKYGRRIFTFGVGYDVNAPLLSNLADKSRATSTFVLPKEDVEAKVSGVFRRLVGPMLAGPVLEVLDADGKVTTRRATDLLPGRLPDLFEGDNLVVLGKYKLDEPLVFRLKGNYQGKERTFQFRFELSSATTRNSFVPRLWASRKIAYLIEEIRQAGAAGGANPTLATATASADPRTNELVDEIVRLSVEFGILTEYTSFLAREGTDLTRRDEILKESGSNFFSRAQNTRSGVGAVNQSVNANFQQNQMVLNSTNGYYDQSMNRVQVARVQQVNDRAFFQQGNRWVDSQAVSGDRIDVKPDETITIGSPEYGRLVERLVKENRNGTLSMNGEILLRVDGKNILVKGE
jgi:Ca-activated chloride channel homolog